MIRWITDSIGSSAWEPALLESGITLIDARSLIDRAGNSAESIRRLLTQSLDALDQGQRILICCDYGISRSNAIASGVLALSRKIPFEEALERVMRATGEKSLKIEVVSAVRRALREMRADSPPDSLASHPLLITGATGNIGRALLPELSPGECIAPSSQEIDLEKDQIKLNEMIQGSGIRTLLHLANPRIHTTNVSIGPALVILKNILDVCIENDLRLIYPSGWEVFSGYRTASLIAEESLKPKPDTTYGLTKQLCERMIEHYRERHGLRVLLLRISPIYGIGLESPKFIHHFIGKAKENLPIETHRYLNARPHLDLLCIKDVIMFFKKAANSEETGIYHLGTGVLTSTYEIAIRIQKYYHSSRSVSEILIENDVANIALDSTKAQKTFGWKPVISIDEGIGMILDGGQDIIQTNL